MKYKRVLTADDILNTLYPVGSIYISTSETSPASFLGGGWSQLTDNFLVGAGSTFSAGATGGSKTHTHALGLSCFGHLYLYDTTRRLEYYYFCPSDETLKTNTKMTFSSTGMTDITRNTSGYSSYSSSTSYRGLRLGGYTDSESTLPPYLAVYMWERIS
ncbi:MAG: hypothetical protein LUD19_06530 [Clostridia bacterium]|nr:hypothetical protein [Clostridia bacterium]